MAGRILYWPAPGAGAVAHATGPSSNRACDGEPALDAPFRPRDRADARELRPFGNAAQPPGTPGLAGDGIHQERVERQEHAPVDDDVHCVSAVFCPGFETPG